MNKAKLILNNKEFTGTFTFEVIVNSIYELGKLEKVYTIPSFLIALTEEDVKAITVFMIQSIVVLEKHTINEVGETYMQDIGSIQNLENFNNIFEYVMELFTKCIPKKKKKEDDSIFEDDEEEFDMAEDWDIKEFQYLWETVLKRNDFYKITPKIFFEQLEVHSKTINRNTANETEM